MSQNEFLELTPTLFVGLGGAGKMVLSEIKRLFVEHPFFEGRIPGMIDFLSIDSDADVDTYKDEDEALRALNKDETLLVHAQVGDIKAFLDRKPYVKNWFPIAQTKNVELSGRGAKQKRYLGRLAFFSSIDEVLEILRTKFTRICSRSLVVNSGKVRMADTGNADVYIVNSLCGGTGSGMFLDLAYVLREVAMDTASKRLAVTGMFLTSEAFHLPGFRENIQRNCASALMELDYLMAPNHIDFSTRYTDTFAVKGSKSKRVYDFAYIINGTDMGDHVAVERTIAHGILSGVITNAGQKKDSVKDNIVYDAVEKNENKYTSFSTYGFGSLLFPGQEIAEVFGLRFASSLLGNITERWDKTNKTMSYRYGTFLSKNYPELSRDVNELLFAKILTDREFQSIVPVGKLPELGSNSESAQVIRSWIKSNQVTDIQLKRLDDKIAVNMKKYSDGFFEAVNKEIKEQLGDYNLGVAFTLKFVETFNAEIADIVSSWEQGLAEMEESIKRMDNAVAASLRKIEEISKAFFGSFMKSDLNTHWENVKNLQLKANKLVFDHNRLERAVVSLKQISVDLDKHFYQVLKMFYSMLEEMRQKTLPEQEKIKLSSIYERKRLNYFVDRIVVDEADIDLRSWFYDKVLFGDAALEEKAVCELWDKFESDFLTKVEMAERWRVYSTSPFDFERQLKDFSAAKFKVIPEQTIEQFLVDKAENKYGKEKSKIRNFYVESLKTLFTASRTTTATSDKRGKYQQVFTLTFGVPDEDKTIFAPDIISEAVVAKTSKVNVASLGFPQRMIMIQTEEALPVTAINGVELWADAYKTSDRYLHALGEEFGIDWQTHLLVRDSYALNVKNSTLYFFMGLNFGIVRKRQPKSSEESVYYIFEEMSDDLFSAGAKGVNLGESIEHSVRELCEKNDKRLLLEEKLKKCEQYKTMKAEAAAGLLRDYLTKLSAALCKVDNQEIKRAYEIISKALAGWVKFYLEQAGRNSAEQQVEGGLEV
ncbi:MAG: tubulin-like doman-containing protein [Candidatus Wallbacteria bacterium]|nr:tubulin-like doman-containing protein [Candidatus Wallbacteria bacterium]